VAHTYGKSFPDCVRGLIGDYGNAPEVVAYPRTEKEVAAVLTSGRSATGGDCPWCECGCDAVS
jgi:hypothetical protein